MRLQECDLDTVAVHLNPLLINQPEAVWTAAHQSKIIPEALYRFYCVADYFSYGSAPRFLSDKSGILFPYLGNLVRGIRDSFEEADELYRAIQKDHARSYSPAKKVKKETWDPRAAHQVRRSFRNLVVVLTGILDQFAEVTAIFFYGEMAEIKVGRATFTDLLNFAKNPCPPIEIIASPRQAHLYELHVSLASELIRTGPDKEWAELLFLYRNKVAHMGNFSFWWYGFPHKTDTEFYMFLPNHWPHLAEEHITQHSSTSTIEPNAIREFAERSFIQQDLIEYLEKLILAVGNVLDRGFDVLTGSYKTFRDCDPLQDSLDSLRKEARRRAFKYFP